MPRASKPSFGLLGLAACALAVALHAAPAGAYEYHQFSRQKEQVLATVRTIALRPLALPAWLENREAIQRQFETELTAALVAAGFRVVSGADFNAVWRQNARRLGGVFDVVTGDLDDDKFNTCYEYSARELARLYDVDAIAIVALAPGAIRGGFARQHHGGYLAYALGDPVVIGGKELRTSAFDELQAIYGAHLELGLYDLAGLSLYLTKVPVDWHRVYWNRSYIDRDQAALSNPARNSAAVREAIRPLQRDGTDSTSASRPGEPASEAATPDGTKPAASKPSDSAQ